MDLLKTMLQNRELEGVSSKMSSMSMITPEVDLKQEIIEKKPKHKKLKEFFEQRIEELSE